MCFVQLVAGVVLIGGPLAGCGADHPDPDGGTAASAPTAAGGASGPAGGGGPGGGASGAAGGGPGDGASGAAGGRAGLVDDPPGLITCTRLAAAVDDGSLMTPGVVAGIVEASRTADAPVADAADRLQRAYDAALGAAGKADEPDAIAAVGAAASDMSGVCADSGLQTAG